MTISTVWLVLLAAALAGQANIPVTRPELKVISPELKKTIDDLEKQCPTCATIDLSSGKQVWLSMPPRYKVQSQIDLPLDDCALPLWSTVEAIAMRAAIVKALDQAQFTEFERNEPKDCARKAFVYQLNVARQLLPKK